MEQKNNFNVQIKELIIYIPLITFLFYLMGFVIESVYLNSIGFNNFEIANIIYLTTGIMCIVLISPPFINVLLLYKEPTDKLKIGGKYLPLILYRNIFASFGAFYLLVGLLSSENIINFHSTNFIIGLSLFSIGFYADFFLTSYAAKNISNKIKNITYLCICGIQLIFICYLNFTPFSMYIFCSMLLCIIVWCMYGEYADEGITLIRFGSLFILFIFLLCIISKYTFPLIPQRYGGFKIDKKIFLVKPEYSRLFKSLGIKINDEVKTEPIQILYEGDQYYLLKYHNIIFKIKKEGFYGTCLDK